MASIQPGNRGGKILVHEGFRYQKNKAKQDRIYWRCWRKTCNAFIQTEPFDIDEANVRINIIHVSNHNHPNDTNLIETTALTQTMIEEIETDPSKPIKRVYNEVVRNSQQDDYVPEFSGVRSRLNRKRASLVPPIPDNVYEVLIEDEWAETWRGANFLCHQDNDWGVLMFGTDENFSKLSRCQDVYIDGTFKSSPRPYKQFVTVHGKYLGRVVPLVMCLSTGKTVGQYRQILTHVKRKVQRVTGHRWRPQRVITDFESSLLLAIQTELPNSQSQGCYFHFCQSLWRRVQELGLSGPYQRHRSLQKCIQKFMAMGYLPVALVKQNYRILSTEIATVRLVQRFPMLANFIQYLERNYIVDGCQFTPQLWNVFGRTSDNRTNNFVEGKN